MAFEFSLSHSPFHYSSEMTKAAYEEERAIYSIVLEVLSLGGSAG